MLEQLSICRYRVAEPQGDNPYGAANQQERLSVHEKKCWFLAGLIEGEGSLCISIKRDEPRTLGYLVQPEFFIYQHRVRRGLLELAQEVFGNGGIRPKQGNEDVLVYSIISRRIIVERVIPFNATWPFHTRRLISNSSVKSSWRWSKNVIAIPKAWSKSLSLPTR